MIYTFLKYISRQAIIKKVLECGLNHARASQIALYSTLKSQTVNLYRILESACIGLLLRNYFCFSANCLALSNRLFKFVIVETLQL